MFRLRQPLFVVLALIAACGGKVLVDSNGGGDPGGGLAGADIAVGSGSTSVGTGGAFGSAGTFGKAGGFGTAGVVTAGFYGVGGAYVAGGAGSFVGGGGAFCGPVICPPGGQCCNPQCGICVPFGAPCPAIACGSAGGFGVGGSTGVAGAFPGGCGSFDTCQARVPGPVHCQNELSCVCQSCMCEANTCENDRGCQQIWQCALKLNCQGKGCYAPQTCQSIIDQFGVGSTSMGLFLKLESCQSGSACASTCTVFDAGPSCKPPPPPSGPPLCSGQVGPGQCSQQCFDGQMNSYVSKCSGGICNCYYDNNLACSCFYNGGFGGFGGSPCGGCCPSGGWLR